MCEVYVDGLHQLRNAGKTAVTYDVISARAKKAPHPIHPGEAGRGEVQVDPRMLGQPRLDDGVLVGGVVVADQMKFEFPGGLPMEHLEESGPIDIRMSSSTASSTTPRLSPSPAKATH